MGLKPDEIVADLHYSLVVQIVRIYIAFRCHAASSSDFFNFIGDILFQVAISFGVKT